MGMGLRELEIDVLGLIWNFEVDIERLLQYYRNNFEREKLISCVFYFWIGNRCE
jgi:hypothetical protein